MVSRHANFAGPESGYPLDNAAPQAWTRLSSLSAIYDDVTARHLDMMGIHEGWSCLDVGAGNGSVAAFMRKRCGQGAQIVATDINTDWLRRADNVDVRRHDIGVDPLPESAFDLVHARAVLTFVPSRRSALTRMIAALRPGGWILIEELMLPPITEVFDDSDAKLTQKARQAILTIIDRSGGDLSFIAEIPRLYTDSGLVDVGAEGFFLPFRTDAVAALARANIEQLGAEIVESGLMTSAELDSYRKLLGRPDATHPPSMALISVWGRRPLS